MHNVICDAGGHGSEERASAPAPRRAVRQRGGAAELAREIAESFRADMTTLALSRPRRACAIVAGHNANDGWVNALNAAPRRAGEVRETRGGCLW